MASSYQQLQQKLTFDELMTSLSAEFELIPDHRLGNAKKYVLADVLKSAFAMFSLKCPSLLDFKQQTIPEPAILSLEIRTNWNKGRVAVGIAQTFSLRLSVGRTQNKQRKLTVCNTPMKATACLQRYSWFHTENCCTGTENHANFISTYY